MVIKHHDTPEWRNKVVNNIWRGAVVLFATITLITLAFAIQLNAKTDREHAKAIREHRVQVGACRRANEKQVSENKSQLADYLFFSTTATLLRVSIKHPAQPQPRHQRKVTEDFVNKLFSYAEAKTWRHLTENCEASIDNPGYKFQPPVKFLSTIILHVKNHIRYVHHVRLPPRGALEVQRGE